jgi:hypothetical protein
VYETKTTKANFQCICSGSLEASRGFCLIIIRPLNRLNNGVLLFNHFQLISLVRSNRQPVRHVRLPSTARSESLRLLRLSCGLVISLEVHLASSHLFEAAIHHNLNNNLWNL